ncbi:MAG: RNA polymerase-binding protein DksA [Alphaproteobacteria bacterium]|nr:RNA polymerase-binding protein DksA [Alphaproteobacteria bacterium]MBQ8631959.1 RNA polymerase-binding protein DksA [Alphaproteobacteria bacterium]
MRRTMMETAVILPPDYKPSENEEYMNELQLEYFRQKLVNWKKSLLAQSKDTLDELVTQGGLNQPDQNDRASLETDKALELRTRDRARKLISKINEALQRIEDGEYGYCEDTGEPIGLARLEARPIATLSIEAQERHERMEKTYDDDSVAVVKA